MTDISYLMNMAIEEAEQTQAGLNKVDTAHNPGNRDHLRALRTVLFIAAVEVFMLACGGMTPRSIEPITKATRAAIMAQTPPATIPSVPPTQESTGYGIDRADIYGYLVDTNPTWYNFPIDENGNPANIPIYGFDKLNNTLILITNVSFGYALQSIGMVSDTPDPTGQIRYAFFSGNYILNGQKYTTFYVDEQFLTVYKVYSP